LSLFGYFCYEDVDPQHACTDSTSLVTISLTNHDKNGLGF